MNEVGLDSIPATLQEGLPALYTRPAQEKASLVEAAAGAHGGCHMGLTIRAAKQSGCRSAQGLSAQGQALNPAG